MDGHRHGIIHPFFKLAYKKAKKKQDNVHTQRPCLFNIEKQVYAIRDRTFYDKKKQLKKTTSQWLIIFFIKAGCFSNDFHQWLSGVKINDLLQEQPKNESVSSMDVDES